MSQEQNRLSVREICAHNKFSLPHAKLLETLHRHQLKERDSKTEPSSKDFESRKKEKNYQRPDTFSSCKEYTY